MRIAILGTKGIPATYGGFETFAEELSTRLVQKGVEVDVFCASRNARTGTEYKGVKLKYVKVPQLGFISTELYDARCIVHALRGYDIVYMLGYGASLFYWLPRIFGVPLWVNMDGLEWKRSKWPWYGKLYLKINEWAAARSAARMIADAENIKSYLTGRYGDGLNCSVIPYGAPVLNEAPDPGMLGEVSVTPGRYYLAVCRLEPENNVREIIDGYIRSSSPHPLIIVGDHRTGTAYVNSLLERQDGRIRFVGTIYDREKLQALRYHALAYFHGHSVGGTNPSLLEAMGCGNIIIAHDNVFNREVAGDAAFYFKCADDIPGVLGTLVTLDAGKKHLLGQNVRDRIRTRYNWDTVAEQYYALLREQNPSSRASSSTS